MGLPYPVKSNPQLLHILPRTSQPFTGQFSLERFISVTSASIWCRVGYLGWGRPRFSASGGDMGSHKAAESGVPTIWGIAAALPARRWPTRLSFGWFLLWRTTGGHSTNFYGKDNQRANILPCCFAGCSGAFCRHLHAGRARGHWWRVV